MTDLQMILTTTDTVFDASQLLNATVFEIPAATSV